VKTRFLQRVFTFNDLFLTLYVEVCPENLSTSFIHQYSFNYRMKVLNSGIEADFHWENYVKTRFCT